VVTPDNHRKKLLESNARASWGPACLRQAGSGAPIHRWMVKMRVSTFRLATIAKSLEDVCRHYLLFAEEHPHEYRLLMHLLSDIFHLDFLRPGRLWVMTQFANRFGGEPEDYSRCFYALLLLCQGAASLLSGDDVAREEVHRNFLQIVDVLIRHNRILRS
jgi:hypothetical protein